MSWRVGLGVAALLAGFARQGSADASECRGRIGPETSLSGRTAYDPFSPMDVADDYRITIGNTGAAACAFGLLFRSQAGRAMLGGTLAYDITGINGSSLLTGATAAMTPLARLTAPLAPNASGAIPFQVVIPRGQFAAPGPYRDSMLLELYALDTAGRPIGGALQTATLAIGYTVPRLLSVNIKGGGTATTVGFGVLSDGQQRTVVIESRSNQTYQLDVTSDNRGVLALTPRIPGQSWSIPYTVSFAGQALKLAGTSGLRTLPPTRPESDASFPLTVIIGEVGQKRAGRYEDVITVEIKAAIP
jgi:hypothetical protein